MCAELHTAGSQESRLCQVGMGNEVRSVTKTCPNGDLVFGNWDTSACVPQACVPTVTTEYAACPKGYTGQQRRDVTKTCPNGDLVYSGWDQGSCIQDNILNCDPVDFTGQVCTSSYQTKKGPIIGQDNIMVGCLGPYTQGSEGDLVNVACGYSLVACNGNPDSPPSDWVYEQPGTALCHAGKWELVNAPNQCKPEWHAEWGMSGHGQAGTRRMDNHLSMIYHWNINMHGGQQSCILVFLIPRVQDA